ncbi:MAG: hypothetical protein CVU59_13185, partial [Deltaproteobacteria bacterium HGW-Deltaproteobacteria-17]
MDLTHLKRNLKGDLFGGLAATLVALPSAIAFGLIIFAPLGAEYSARGAIGGILGCIAIGFLAPLLGGTARLVSAPCAPAAAVLSVFVMEMVRRDGSPSALALVPAYLSVVILISAGLQILAGTLKGGRIIKYIPYPVVAGYLSGVGLLIFTAQLPKLAGMPKGTTFFAALSSPGSWQTGHLIVGGVTMAAMVLAPRFIKAIPGAIIALFSGVLAYFALALTDSSLLTTVGNPAVIGPILPKNVSFADMLSAHFSSFGGMRLADLMQRAGFAPGGASDVSVTGFAIDHRKVAPGTVFGAFQGAAVNGEDFIAAAIEAGAVAIIARPEARVAGALHIADAQPRRAFAQLAAGFFAPVPHTIVAVTGTNGKTSC